MTVLIYKGLLEGAEAEIKAAEKLGDCPYETRIISDQLFIFLKDESKLVGPEQTITDVLNQRTSHKYESFDFQVVQNPLGYELPEKSSSSNFSKDETQIVIDLSTVNENQKNWYLACAQLDPEHIIYNKVNGTIVLNAGSTLLQSSTVKETRVDTKIVHNENGEESIQTSTVAEPITITAPLSSLVVEASDVKSYETVDGTDIQDSSDLKLKGDTNIVAILAGTALGITGAALLAFYLTGFLQDWAAKKVRKGSRNTLINKLALAGSLKHLKFKGHVIKYERDGVEDGWVDSTELYNVFRIYPLVFYNTSLFLTSDYDCTPRSMKIVASDKRFYVYGIVDEGNVRTLLTYDEDYQKQKLVLPSVADCSRYYLNDN